MKLFIVNDKNESKVITRTTLAKDITNYPPIDEKIVVRVKDIESYANDFIEDHMGQAMDIEVYNEELNNARNILELYSSVTPYKLLYKDINQIKTNI